MKLIIDTDPGIDDVLAIALAHAMPEIELLGLTTIFGNTFVDQSSRNARFLLDLLGADLPVAQGASLPYGALDYHPSAHVHGPEGLGARKTVPQIGQNTDETAARFLVRMAAENLGDLTICAIGPLTNIADALKLDPQFAQNLKQLVIMGGAFDCRGNITPHAEANIYHDAQAADDVFASDLDMVLVGLDTTMKTLLTAEDFTEMATTSQTIGGFVDEISQFYLGFYRSVGVTDGCPMHDATAVLACAHPERFTFQDSGLRSSLDAGDFGATLADPSRRHVKVATDVDAIWAVDTVKSAIARLD